MKSTEIASLVTERALRFGSRNPQQFNQLCLRLGNEAEAEVARGLLHVFTEGLPPPEGSTSQELAGELLAALCPRAEFDLK